MFIFHTGELQHVGNSLLPLVPIRTGDPEYYLINNNKRRAVRFSLTLCAHGKAGTRVGTSLSQGTPVINMMHGELVDLLFPKSSGKITNNCYVMTTCTK